MNFLKLMQMLSSLSDINEADIKVCDLKTKEGLKSYNEQLDILENADLDVLNMFGINGKEWINGMRELGQQIYEQNNNEKRDSKKQLIKESMKQMKRKEEDHTVEDIDDEDLLDFDDEEPKLESKKFIRPSELLNVNQKLQLHKIVQEYVDTMIKPYNKGALTTQQINDAYAGLYEFAAWVMNK